WFKTMKTDEAAAMLNTAGKETAIKVLSGFDTNKAVEIMLKFDANVRASVVTGMSEDTASLAVVTGWFKTMKSDDAAGILNVAGKDTAVKVLSGLDVNKAVDIIGKVTPEIMNTVIADMAGNQDTLTVVTGWFKTMAPAKASEILNSGSKEVIEKILSGLDANKAVDIVLGLSQENRQAVISDMVSNPDTLKTAGEWLSKADKAKGVDLLARLISEDPVLSGTDKTTTPMALNLFVNVSDPKRQNELLKGVTDKFNTIKNSLVSEKDTAKKESMQKTVDNFGKYTEQWNAVKKEAFFQLAAKEGNSYELTGDKLTKTQQVFTKTSELWKSLFGKDFSWSPENVVVKGVDSKILSGSVFEDVTSLYDAKTNTLYVKDGVASMPDIWRERENAFLVQAGNNAAAEKKEIQIREKALLLMTDLGIDQQKLIDTSTKDAQGVRSVLEGIDHVGYDSFKAGVKNVGVAAITSMILDNPSYLGASLLDMDKADNVTAGLLCTIMGSNPENINPGVDSAYTTFSRLNSGSQAEVFNGIVDYYYKEQSEIKDSAQKTQHEEKGLLRRMDGVAAFMQKFQSSSTVTGYIAKGDDERLIKVADLVKPNIANGIIQNAAKNYSKDLDEQIQKEADLLLKVKAENSGAIFGYFDTATQDKIVSQIGIQKTSPIMDGYYKASPTGANAYMARINLQTGIDIMRGMDKENVKKIFSSFSDKIAASYIETMLTEDQQSNLVDVYNGNQNPKVLDASGNTVGMIRTATVVRGENNLPTGISLSDTEFYPLDYQSLQVEKSPQASVTGKKAPATFNVVLTNNKEVLRQTAADKRAFSVYSELLPDKGRFYDHDFKEIVKNRIMDTPDKRPLAILVFAQYDNNGAISNKSDIISSVISNGYRVMYYKADTDADAINSVKSAAQVGTSREQRANFIWFEGHGNLRSIRWGNGSGGSDYFNAADYNNMKQMGPSLEDGGTVVVSACNGARRLDYDGTLCESMAELIADAFWQQAGHVYATDQESISLNHLEFYNGRVSGVVWNLLDNCDSSGSHCQIVGNPHNFDVSVRNMPNRLTPATNI
ncbi:MAG: hypothetical protein PHE58_03630, partial [Candidatus Omnitrophica bacterium]|nr:hypothetical protein [Candidatus Omnitrophota bacterium]